MKPTLVKCECCGGTGKAKLPDVYQQTLDAIPLKGVVSTKQIIDHLRVEDPFLQATAVNNRLRLFLQDKFELVTSEKRGKSLFWKRVK